jgi:hypothetical protein
MRDKYKKITNLENAIKLEFELEKQINYGIDYLSSIRVKVIKKISTFFKNAVLMKNEKLIILQESCLVDILPD